MTYEKTTYGRLPTPWGDLLVWCNGHDKDGFTVGFRTEWEHNRDRGTTPPGGWEGMPETITLHRVEYSVNAFAVVSDQGGVTAGSDRTPLMRKSGTNANSWPGVNEPATRKFWAEIVPALEAWAQTEAGKAVMAAGAYADAHNDLEYVEQAIKEAQVKLDTLREKRKVLGKKVATFAVAKRAFAPEVTR